MRPLAWLRSALDSLLHRARIESEMDEELRAHIASRAEDLERSGMPRPDAERRARIEFGGQERFKEECREQRGGLWAETLWRDLKFGLRILRRTPGFTSVAVLTLALGVGANTAIFSVVDQVLLKPLPYREPGRLVWADEYWPRLNDSMVPNPEYTNWNLHNHSFEELAAYDGGSEVNITGAGDPERVECVGVTANFLRMLGVRPAIGRDFLAAEARPGGGNVAILADSVWRRKFSGDANIVGKAVTLNAESYTVVGVMPAYFRFPDRRTTPEILLTNQLPPAVDWTSKRLSLTRVIGRLKPSVHPAEATTDLANLAKQSDAQVPAAFVHMREGLQVHVMGLHQKLSGDVRTTLLILLAAVGLVLLIVCVNVANLQLARSSVRQKELALRGAIGAGRTRLFRQLLTESAVLAAGGGILGVLLAVAGVTFLRAFAPESFLQAGRMGIDGRVLLFTLGISFLSVFVFGVAPALHASNPDINASLKEGGASSRSLGRVRKGFVVCELAMSVVLLAASGLLLHSFVRLSNVHVGFDPGGLLTINTDLPESKYPQPGQRAAFFNEVQEKVRTLPGVLSVGFTTSLPLTSFVQNAGFAVGGRPDQPAGMRPMVPVEHISAGYLETLRVPLLAGRFFDERDSKPGISPVICNQAFARQYFPNEDAVGKRIRFGAPEAPWGTIVGIAGDVRHIALDKEPEPEVYVLYGTEDETAPTAAVLVLRTEGDPRNLAAAVRHEVATVDPEQPVFSISTMKQRVFDAMTGTRFNATLVGFFALMALVIAAIGLYGVIAYFVAQRTHEIGVRMALGATGEDVLRLVMTEGAMITASGLLIGLAGSLLAGRFLAGLLYRVRPSDPMTFLGVLAVLGATALAACYVPARRATKVDPMVALRYE